MGEIDWEGEVTFPHVLPWRNSIFFSIRMKKRDLIADWFFR
jgi:hypothetical protein